MTGIALLLLGSPGDQGFKSFVRAQRLFGNEFLVSGIALDLFKSLRQRRILWGHLVVGPGVVAACGSEQPVVFLGGAML